MREPRNLGEFPYRRVSVACAWCPWRRGSYDTVRLIERLGPRVSLDALLATIARSCPRPKPWGKRGPSQYVPWCRAAFDDLAHGRPPDRTPG